MIWVAIGASAFVLVGISALALVLRRRIRWFPPVHRNGAVRDTDADGGVYALNQNDLAAFRRSMQEEARAHQVGWDRDYSNVAGVGLPGRIGGIPRALRVKGERLAD